MAQNGQRLGTEVPATDLAALFGGDRSTAAYFAGAAEWARFGVHIDDTSMLRPDGTPDPSLFTEDMLHMNDAGCARWTAVLRRTAEAMAAAA